MTDHFRTNPTERRQDTERLVRVEARLDYMDEKMVMHGKTLGNVADDIRIVGGQVTEIKLMMANNDGGKKMLGYLAHAATAVVASVTTILGLMFTMKDTAKAAVKATSDATSIHLGGP